MTCVPRRLDGLLVLALCIVAVARATSAESGEPLRVCLEANYPPFSSATDSDQGIDHQISAHVAAALGRPLQTEWFDASGDDEIPMAHRADQLLTETGCDLIAGYPLTRDSLRAPTEATLPSQSESREPPGLARRRELLASRPYLSLPLTVVSAADGLTVGTLDDLVGLRVVVERGSLASVIANVYAGAVLQERLLRVSSEADAIFESLETGATDAALVERHRFELYRGRRPGTRLRDTGYQHPLGVNTGFVGRAAKLMAEVDVALRDLLVTGRAARIVEAQGLSYSTPTRPAILPSLTPRLLAQPASQP